MLDAMPSSEPRNECGMDRSKQPPPVQLVMPLAKPQIEEKYEGLRGPQEA